MLRKTAIRSSIKKNCIFELKKVELRSAMSFSGMLHEPGGVRTWGFKAKAGIVFTHLPHSNKHFRSGLTVSNLKRTRRTAKGLTGQTPSLQTLHIQPNGTSCN